VQQTADSLPHLLLIAYEGKNEHAENYDGSQ